MHTPEVRVVTVATETNVLTTHVITYNLPTRFSSCTLLVLRSLDARLPSAPRGAKTLVFSLKLGALVSKP